MKIIAPKNIYSSILLNSLSKDVGIELVFLESALITKELETNTSAVGMIPTLDLIKHQHLHVSGKTGVSFDGLLSNSYIYFLESEHKPENLYLRGDISLNEIILSKILFSERFSSQVQVSLETSQSPASQKNYIVVGDENFTLWNVNNGLSFSDEIAEMLDLPYVSFVFASLDKSALTAFNDLSAGVDGIIEDRLENILDDLSYSSETKSLIKDNLESVYFEMTENENTAVNELIKLVYYHGIIDDMFDVKFV